MQPPREIAASRNGEGSEFVITDPATISTGGASRRPPSDVRLNASPQSPDWSAQTASSGHLVRPLGTVVIVEDQQDNREILRALLMLEGFNVLAAKDGEEGIALILAARPQVAIIDVGLPKINGYGVARHVRAGLKDEILLIASTGHGGPEDVKDALDAGFDEHMLKPLDLKRLRFLLQSRSTRL